MADLRHVESWVFDLDNTLYPAECRLFAQIDLRMAEFIRSLLGVDHAEARRLQKHFYVKYGTTLAGLMAEHDVAPDDFLAHVHDIDRSAVPENPALRRAIEALPGKRHIFTNGSVAHAEKTLARIGLDGLFNDIFDIRAAEWTPKPHLKTYEKFVAATGVLHHPSYPEIEGCDTFAGAFIGYRGTGRDITERKRMEDELRQHRDHLEEMVAARTRDLDELSRACLAEPCGREAVLARLQAMSKEE